MQRPWTVVTVVAVSLLVGSVSGCGRGNAAADSGEPQDIAVLARKPHAPADLSRPFNVLAWNNSGARRDPMSVASQLAASAGGDWLAVLPKRSDDIQWQPQFAAMYGRGAVVYDGDGAVKTPDNSVESCIKAIKETGTRVAVSNADGRATLLFGSDDDLAHLRVHPPKDVAGVLVQAQSSAGMVAQVADFWKLKVRVDPALLKRRDALLAVHQSATETEESGSTLSLMSVMYRGMIADRTTKALNRGLLVRIDERTTPENLLTTIARYIGGECRAVEGGWEIGPVKDSKAVTAEIARLEEVVDSQMGREIVHSTPNPVTNEPIIVIGALREEAEAAMENIAAYGPVSVPTLRSYLDPAKASAAHSALRLLAAMPHPEAKKAILDFAERLRSGRKLEGKPAQAAQLLLGEVVKALSNSTDGPSKQWLADAVRDPRVTSDLRLAARMALVKTGALSLLTAGPEKTDPLLTPARFTLSAPPEGAASADPAPGSATPVATCKGSDGASWAVFMSGRCGDSLGLWLARGDKSQWQEFLFAGKSFPRNMGYAPYGVRPPRPGCLKVKVEGDTVTLEPPDQPKENPRIAVLQAKLSNRKLSRQERMRLAQQLAVLQQATWQRRANQLQQPMSFQLADLRKDSDNDGLSDLMEKQCGTDMAKSDTDGDGLPDGQDQNPIVARNPTATARERFLQAVFTALYSGDPNPDPIIVVLDKSQWQEFHGTRAPVYCMTKADFMTKANKHGAWRALQFGGATDQGSTILKLDGPCAYNDSGTRAEVHFWQWSPRTATAYPWMMMYGMDTQSTPRDYVATFTREGGGWRLDGIRPWKMETVDTAYAEYMRKAMENGMY